MISPKVNPNSDKPEISFIVDYCLLKNWALLKLWLEDNSYDLEHLNYTCQEGEFKGANGVWLLAHFRQDTLLRILMDKEFITFDSLLTQCDSFNTLELLLGLDNDMRTYLDFQPYLTIGAFRN